MKKAKKMLALLLAAAMTFGAAGQVSAADVMYSQNSIKRISQADADNSAKTTVLTLNKENTGKLATAASENWYKFTTNGKGYFTVALKLSNSADGSKVGRGWKMSIFKKGDLVNAIQSFSDVGTAGAVSGYLPFSKGDYYICISASNALSAPTGVNYGVKVTYKEDSAWEQEYNETNSTATGINVNKTYYGTTYANTDVDWYKVKTTANGYFNLDFQIDGRSNLANIQMGWNISIYDKNYSLIHTYTGITSNYKGAILPYSKGTFYIKINPNWEFAAPVDCIYKLKVNQKSSSAWETEYNVKSSTANSISLNKQYSGTLYDSNDIDWYTINVKAKGVVKFSFAKASSANIEDIGRGWNFSVYDKASGKELKTLSGITAKNNASLTLAKGTYLIKVAANWNMDAPVDCVYNLKASYAKTPGKAKIKSISTKTTSATVKWGKVDGATGYYVYRSTSKNGKYTKVATIKKGSTVTYKNTKLKSNKNYYYKVSAYTTANGVTAEGTKSAVKQVKTKK